MATRKRKKDACGSDDEVDSPGGRTSPAVRANGASNVPPVRILPRRRARDARNPTGGEDSDRGPPRVRLKTPRRTTSGGAEMAPDATAAPPGQFACGKLGDDAVLDAVIKVFCIHTEPNFSLAWQRKRQYASSGSGFAIPGNRILTNAHCVDHHAQVRPTDPRVLDALPLLWTYESSPWSIVHRQSQELRQPGQFSVLRNRCGSRTGKAAGRICFDFCWN